MVLLGLSKLSTKLVESSGSLWAGSLWTRTLWARTAGPGAHGTTWGPTGRPLHARLLTDELDSVLDLGGVAADVEQLLSHVGWRVTVQLYVRPRLAVDVADCFTTCTQTNKP